MSTAMDGNEFHLDFGVVAPEHLLDVNSSAIWVWFVAGVPAMRLRSESALADDF